MSGKSLPRAQVMCRPPRRPQEASDLAALEEASEDAEAGVEGGDPRHLNVIAVSEDPRPVARAQSSRQSQAGPAVVMPEARGVCDRWAPSMRSFCHRPAASFQEGGLVSPRMKRGSFRTPGQHLEYIDPLHGAGDTAAESGKDPAGSPG